MRFTLILTTLLTLFTSTLAVAVAEAAPGGPLCVANRCPHKRSETVIEAPKVIAREPEAAPGGPLCVANRCPHKIRREAMVEAAKIEMREAAPAPVPAPAPEAEAEAAPGGPLCIANRCPHKVRREMMVQAAVEEKA
jgi:nitrite reductase/ring-hydroxylating ferredoxin subunit